MKDLHTRFPVYSRLLHLYPGPYRRRFEEEILQTTADMLEEATTPFGKARVWAQVMADLPENIGRQQLNYVGGIMHTETPTYLKRNSTIAGALVLPFFLIIIINSLSGHAISRTWLWHTPAMAVWLLYMPQIALLVTLVTYALYTHGTGKSARQSWIKRVLDFKHTWLLILPLMAAFGILFFVGFHDSVQCWVQPNPIHAIPHVQQAWNCTMQNKSTEAFRFF